ncbi:PAS domain S-box protein [Sphingomonas sp.]|uniref:PAS domain S-box protein n=1 Tax=Sphingomonas sp. TaxID=28214 RepID=UPI003AFFED61
MAHPEPPSPAEPLDAAAAREFALIADAAPVPMWTTRGDGTRGFVNRAYLEFSGLSYADALAADWRDVLHPDDAARVRQESVAGVAAGTTFTIEARFRRHDGEWRWLRSVSRPRVDGAGADGGYVGVAHDITDARIAEQQVRAREQQLSALIDQTSAGLAQVDMSGRFTLVNDRFCAIVGRPRETLMGLTMQAITHPDDLPRNLPLFEAAVRDGVPYAIEKRFIRPEDGSVWVSNSVAVIRRPDGSPYGVLAVTLDITARREAESAVRESEALLQFLDRLNRATAALTDADAVLAITTRMLAEHLGAEGCAYADVEADGDRFHTRGAWHLPPLSSLVGSYRLSDLGAAAVARLRAGEPWVVTDHRADPADAGVHRDIGIHATICFPFVKAERLAGLMAVHAAVPRRWTPAELTLVREVSERSWAHVERVRAEAALRESERQLRLAMEGARIGTWERNLRTGRGRWSRRTAEIMGASHDEPLTQAAQLAMTHPDDRDRIDAGVARLVREGGDFAVEYRIVNPDGAVRWVASHGLVMRDAAGIAIRAVGTMRDVTERREAQEALTRLNQTLESQVADRTAERDRMWRLSRDLFVVVDGRRRVRAVNPAIAGMGYTPDEVVGRALGGFIHPDERAGANAAIRRAAAQPISEFHARLRHADGSWRRFAWSVAPGDGEAYVIGRDVTAETERRAELEQAQDELRQVQKVESLGQLTGGVAHDFNNLLTPIIGNLDLLARRAGDDERQARLIRSALESAERARLLVQRLLAFARRQPLQPGPVDLEGLIGGMAGLVASTIGPQVEVHAEVAPGLPPALVDRNQLELAILNLAVNARDAMPDGGRLRLVAGLAEPDTLARTGLTGAFIVLCVADTGTGMDAATAARAIEPFFSTKGVGKGTGLGLSMVHGLASQLGGAMLIDSAPGEGTRIELLLPIAPAPVPTAAAPVPIEASRSGRVLLVDDEQPVRDATAAMLGGLGYEVEVAASGEEALGLLDGQDYLVTDHLMPGMKGGDLVRAARARRPGLKALVISGYAALDEVPADVPRLAKPFRLDELARAIGALG